MITKIISENLKFPNFPIPLVHYTIPQDFLNKDTRRSKTYDNLCVQI